MAVGGCWEETALGKPSKGGGGEEEKGEERGRWRQEGGRQEEQCMGNNSKANLTGDKQWKEKY